MLIAGTMVLSPCVFSPPFAASFVLLVMVHCAETLTPVCVRAALFVYVCCLQHASRLGRVPPRCTTTAPCTMFFYLTQPVHRHFYVLGLLTVAHSRTRGHDVGCSSIRDYCAYAVSDCGTLFGLGDGGFCGLWRLIYVGL